MAIIDTPESMMLEIAERAKAARLKANLTQEGLSQRTAIGLSTLKQFERTGKISLAALLRIAFVLEHQADFHTLFSSKPETYRSLDALLESNKPRKRGRKS